MKKLLIAASLISIPFLSGCDDADVVSHNLSKAADNFEIARRVVFYNGITGDYILEVQGLCSVQESGSKVSFTCKDDNEKFLKHQLSRSDNVTYFSEQLSAQEISVYNYRVIYKPDVIIPDFNVRTQLSNDDTNY